MRTWMMTICELMYLSLGFSGFLFQAKHSWVLAVLDSSLECREAKLGNKGLRPSP